MVSRCWVRSSYPFGVTAAELKLIRRCGLQEPKNGKSKIKNLPAAGICMTMGHPVMDSLSLSVSVSVSVLSVWACLCGCNVILV